MADFDVEEALHQWSRLKRELSGQPFFVLPFRKFWENVSAHYNTANRYLTVLIPIRITMPVLMDTSCCERVKSSQELLPDIHEAEHNKKTRDLPTG